MWQIETTNTWEKDAKYYQKKRPREFEAVMNNLQRYLSQLNTAVNSKCVQAGYLHSEQAGVLALDQRGSAGHLQETRMYTYAHEASKVLYLITIGNKESQPSDVILSRDFVRDNFSTA